MPPEELEVDERSIAVLPFANLSEDRANEYFADGLSDELLNLLSRVAGLRVVARTSSFSFKGRTASATESHASSRLRCSKAACGVPGRGYASRLSGSSAPVTARMCGRRASIAT